MATLRTLPTEISPRRDRVQFIDAAKGCAMLFVLLSHFAFAYFSDPRPSTGFVLIAFGMIASPTFVLMNGALVGFLYRTRTAADFERLRIRLIDRGLFLLSVGHLAILGAHPSSSARCLLITDMIAVCMFVQPWLIVRTRPFFRVAVSLAAYTFSWIMIESWHPHGAMSRIVEETLFGSLIHTVYLGGSFPLLPWFALDLMGTALGERLGTDYVRGNPAAMSSALWKIAVAGLGAAAAVKGAYLASMYGTTGHTLRTAAHALTSPLQKEPPSPVYFLFYGSIGLFLVAGCLALERAGRAERAIAAATSLGQTSLFVFVAQFYIFFRVIEPLHTRLPFTAWPEFLFASIVLVVMAGLAWHRLRCNRFLTVGYVMIAARRDARPQYSGRDRDRTNTVTMIAPALRRQDPDFGGRIGRTT